MELHDEMDNKIGNGKICDECGRYRDRSEFRQHGKSKDGLQTVCIFCKPLKVSVQEDLQQIKKVVGRPRKHPLTHLKITIGSGKAEVIFKCELRGEPLNISIERDSEVKQ